MGRYAASATSTAGSATLPIAALVGGTTSRPKIIEIGCSNTSSTTAVSIAVRRITTAGTPGTGLTESPESGTNDIAALATAFNTYSSTGPTLSDELRRATLGPLAGIVWTFAGDGLVIPATANAGVAIIPTGTGQVCDFWFVWDE
jgi:hypothetical protein